MGPPVDEATVTTFAALIADLLSRDPDDPSHMPVTRDLSGYNRKMILAYLESIAPALKADVKGPGGPGHAK